MTSSDLLMTILCVFDTIKIILYTAIAYAAYLYISWIYGEIPCRLIMKAQAVAYFMTEFIIIVLTWIRYRVINADHIINDYRKRTVLLLCFGVFCFLVTAASLPEFYEWHVHRYGDTLVCELNNRPWIVAGAPVVILPALFLGIVSYRVRKQLSLSTTRIKELSDDEAIIAKRADENRRAFLIVAVITIGFTLAWLPVSLIHVVDHFRPPEAEERVKQLLSWYMWLLLWLSAADSCVSTFAFTLFNNNFKAFAKKILSCVWLSEMLGLENERGDRRSRTGHTSTSDDHLARTSDIQVEIHQNPAISKLDD